MAKKIRKVARRRPRDPQHRKVRIVERTFRQLMLTTETDMYTLDQGCGRATGYASQVLCGRVRMTFHHVLKWLEVMDVPPSDFFQLLTESMKPKYRIEHLPPTHDEVKEMVALIANELMSYDKRHKPPTATHGKKKTAKNPPNEGAETEAD